MTKRLIVILALAFLVGIAVNAYAEVQNVKVSGDINVLGLTRELGLNNGEGTGALDVTNDKDQSIWSIVRLRVDADLTDNVATTVRLINDRHWGSNDATSANSDIDLDLAYVTLKEFLFSPATLMVGKQELHYGNDMIVGDPTTNNIAAGDSNMSSEPDLDMRKSFDAIRLVLNYDPLVVDIITAKVQEDTVTVSADEDLYGINAAYALNKTNNLEGYWFERRIGGELGALPNKPDRTDVLGARIVNRAADNLTIQAEAAIQLGKDRVAGADQTADRRGFAAEGAVTYGMPNMKYTPSLTGLYAYFSGNRGNNNRNSAWDPMYENQKFGDIANAQFPQSNAHIAGVIATAKATDDVTLKGEYYAFWWDKKYGEGQLIATASPNDDTVMMRHEKFAGQELDLTATYDYTEDVQFALMGGIFLPGEAFDKQTDNTASEVIGSMKVTF